MEALRIILMRIQIMLHIPLRRKQVSWIFKEATKTLPFWEYMCLSIQDVAYSKRAVTELAKFGFTRDNYHDFIKKHYPEFKDLLVGEEHCAWIYFHTDNEKDVINTKHEFLMYLSRLCLKT